MAYSNPDFRGTLEKPNPILVDGLIPMPGATLSSPVYYATATITSAAAATAVSLVPNTAIPTGKKVYLVKALAYVDGATAWGTTATVKIQDTNGTPVDFITYAVAALTGNTLVFESSANVTVEAAFAKGSGGTASKGLQLKGNANGTGSNLIVQVWYMIK